jgi:hypothetical protein
VRERSLPGKPVRLGSVDRSGGARVSPSQLTSSTCPVCPPAPTTLPTKPPTKAPAGPVCRGTSFWLYDPSTNAPIRTLANNTATCLAHPYNIEVRPCAGSTALANSVQVRLTTGSGRVTYKSTAQRVPPFVLFGPPATTGDVLPSPKPLPNGQYYLSVKGAPGWGGLTFTHYCPCPKKGKKGCKQKKLAS